MTPLKEIEAWCYKQIELINRLYNMKDFPDEVERCGMLEPLDIAQKKRVHIFTGIEKISAALKLPIHIKTSPYLDSDMYKKTVTHLGVEFFQLFHGAKG
ncbi:MAG: hypothetical protein IJ471_01475 [Eubacterium sp.]|nr:hypothetical protein [Eubacterium sp.]